LEQLGLAEVRERVRLDSKGAIRVRTKLMYDKLRARLCREPRFAESDANAWQWQRDGSLEEVNSLTIFSMTWE